MNIKEYISSGILELYASGTLSNAESEQVEENLIRYPELREELDKIQRALFVLSGLNQKSPSDEVRNSILKKISSDANGLSSIQIKNVKSRYSAGYKFLLAACIAVLIISLVYNFFLRKDLDEANYRISFLNEKIKLMSQDFEEVNKKLAKTAGDMNIMTDRNYKMININGNEKSPGSRVLTFWNPSTNKVYIKIENLPIPPKNKQYQLWALKNGKPVDLGMMEVDPSDKSLHSMKDIDDAQVFAITLEPMGGSSSPTMDELYATGKL